MMKCNFSVVVNKPYTAFTAVKIQCYYTLQELRGNVTVLQHNIEEKVQMNDKLGATIKTVLYNKHIRKLLLHLNHIRLWVRLH